MTNQIKGDGGVTDKPKWVAPPQVARKDRQRANFSETGTKRSQPLTQPLFLAPVCYVFVQGIAARGRKKPANLLPTPSPQYAGD